MSWWKVSVKKKKKRRKSNKASPPKKPTQTKTTTKTKQQTTPKTPTAFLLLMWIIWKHPPKMATVFLSDTNLFYFCCLSQSSATEPLCSGCIEFFSKGQKQSFSILQWGMSKLHCVSIKSTKYRWLKLKECGSGSEKLSSSPWKGDEHLVFLIHIKFRIQYCLPTVVF